MKTSYEEKSAKVKNSLSCWELPPLSLLGKITVLKKFNGVTTGLCPNHPAN